jgi:hypothetical protein
LQPLQEVFPAWYSLVDPTAESAKIVALVSSITTTASKFPHSDARKLIRLFYRFPVDQAFESNFRKMAQEGSEQSAAGDGAMLAILAGAVIYAIAAKSSTAADAVSLGVQCIEISGVRSANRIDQVVQQTQHYLKAEGVRVRESNGKTPVFQDEAFTKQLSGLSAHHGAGLPTYAPQLEEILGKLSQAIGKFSKEVAKHIDEFAQVREEESDILYWLLGEKTRTNLKYGELDLPRACFLAAYDLAEMTKLLPGPIGASLFLRKMLSNSLNGEKKKVTFSESVNSLTDDDRKAFIPRFTISDPIFSPLLFAVSKAEEGGGKGWGAAFTTQTSLDPKKAIEPVKLAEQIYSEILLIRALS